MISYSSAIARDSLDANFELIEAVAEAGNGLVDLWEASPTRLDSNTPRTDEIIDILFPANHLLCCALDHHRFDTRIRTHWYKLSDLQFIVPNPLMFNATVKKPNGILGVWRGHRYRFKLIRGSFLEVWEDRGSFRLSSRSRWIVPRLLHNRRQLYGASIDF